MRFCTILLIGILLLGNHSGLFAQTKPATKPANVEAAERTWTDRTGKHQVHAALVRLNGDTVELRKPDGTVISLHLSTLSDPDQKIARDSAQDILAAYHPWRGDAAKLLRKRARFSGWQIDPEAIKVETPSGEKVTLLISGLAQGSQELARRLKMKAQEKNRLPSDEVMANNLEAEKQLALKNEQARLAAFGKEKSVELVPLTSKDLPFAYGIPNKQRQLDVLNPAFGDFRAFVSDAGALTVLLKYTPPDSPEWSNLQDLHLSYSFSVVLQDLNGVKLGSLSTETGVRWVHDPRFASFSQISAKTGGVIGQHALKFHVLEHNKEMALTFQVNARDLKELASVKFLVQPHSQYQP